MATEQPNSGSVQCDAPEIVALVERRRAARQAGDFKAADAIRNELLHKHSMVVEDLPGGRSFARRRDVGPKRGAPPTRRDPSQIIETSLRNGGRDAAYLQATSVSQLANAALALVNDGETAQRDGTRVDAALRNLVQAAHHRLRDVPASCPEVAAALAAANTAFTFALAGVVDTTLYNLLGDAIATTLRKRGRKMKAANVMAALEKVAAAGLHRGHECFQVALELVAADRAAGHRLGFANTKSVRQLERAGALSTFDDQPLLWLFRHATRQRKRRVQELPRLSVEAVQAAVTSPTHETRDASAQKVARLELDASCHDVLDIGCGFGVSLLGLADELRDRTLRAPQDHLRVGPIDLSSQHCRLFGFDLNSAATTFAQSAVRRLGLSTQHVHFVTATAEDALRWAGADLQSAQRPVSILLQFPTPFKISDARRRQQEQEQEAQNDQNQSNEASEHEQNQRTSSGSANINGNSQLPGDNDAFMVNDRIVRMAVEAMRRRPGGFLYLQSNVEDVAVAMRRRIEVAARGVLVPHVPADDAVDDQHTHHTATAGSTTRPAAVETAEAAAETLNLRQKRLAEAASCGGSIAECVATGSGWLKHSPMPRRARTETEVAYATDGKPVYRVLFVHAHGRRGEMTTEGVPT